MNAQELDALPVDEGVLDRDDDLWEKRPDGGWRCVDHFGRDVSADELRSIYGPIRRKVPTVERASLRGELQVLRRKLDDGKTDPRQLAKAVDVILADYFPEETS